MPTSSTDPSALLAGDRGRGGRVGLTNVASFLRRGARSAAATDQVEERVYYSKQVVALDALWNLAYVVVAGVVVWFSREERPAVPLRLWIAGYAVQCIVWVVCVLDRYRRGVGGGEEGEEEDRRYAGAEYGLVPDLEMGWGSSGHRLRRDQSEETTSFAKHLGSVNTMFSYAWWIIGFYWVSAGGQALTQEAPQLYWLCIVFLAFDVFIVVFFLALACLIGVAICCCLPCFIALLYAVDQRQGAPDEAIHQLPKYKYRRLGDSDDARRNKEVITMIRSDQSIEHALSSENAECCICLSQYDDGVELRELPCSHHFHCSCIDTWLHINATCPLCKYCIVKANNDELEV